MKWRVEFIHLRVGSGFVILGIVHPGIRPPVAKARQHPDGIERQAVVGESRTLMRRCEP